MHECPGLPSHMGRRSIRGRTLFVRRSRGMLRPSVRIGPMHRDERLPNERRVARRLLRRKRVASRVRNGREMQQRQILPRSMERPFRARAISFFFRGRMLQCALRRGLRGRRRLYRRNGETGLWREAVASQDGDRQNLLQFGRIPFRLERAAVKRNVFVRHGGRMLCCILRWRL